jgi:hypothetical protein
MKNLLNNISKEEKNRILEMHSKEKNTLLNEMSIISPLDFTTYLTNLKEQEGKIFNINDLNDIFKGSDIHFSDFDEYYETLKNEKEKIVAPKDLMLMGGVKFALYNTNIDKINIVIEPSLFFEFINSNVNKKSFYNFLRLILRHESIHLQQVNKMGKSNYVLDASPTINAKKYWTSQPEIMAYAQSLIDDLRDKGHDDVEIENFLRNEKNINSWIHNVYKQVLDKKQYKKFMKYVYLYLKNSK